MLGFHKLNRLGVVGNLPFVLGLVLLIFLPKAVYAHRDGCHRWHSCPSDSGSYVCGDLGYTTYCPNQPVVAPTPTFAPPSTVVPIATIAPVPTVDVAPVAHDVPGTTIITGEVQTTILNVRSGPGTSYPIIGTLDQGVRIAILEKGNEWLRFSMAGNSNSWVSAAYVTEVKHELAAAPIETGNNPAGNSAIDSPAIISNQSNAPILLSPINSQAVSNPLNFQWFWGGTLASGQGFDVQVWPEGAAPMGIAHPSFVINQGAGNYSLPLPALSYAKGVTYVWTVRIVQIETGVELAPSAAPTTFRYE